MKKLIDVGTVFKDSKRDLIITDLKYINKLIYFKYKCNKCGFDCGKHYKNQEHKEEYWIYKGSLLGKNKIGCACCNNQIIVEGINDIPTTAPWMIKYFQGGYDEAKMYSKYSTNKIYPKCPDCGRVKDKCIGINNIYTRQKIACSFCGDGFSYPSKFTMSMLEQLKIDFITEYSPDWIKPKRYDFYIPSMNLIIEMDGGLGHGNRVYPKSNHTIEELIEIDNYKDKIAIEHGIDVIRIDCKNSKIEYIKQNILNSRLNKIFNLKNVDWIKCNICGVSNKEKYVYELFKNGYTREQISIKTNIKISTVYTYIRNMNKINGVNTEHKVPNNKVCIKLFKNKKMLGVFSSYVELSRKSMELFGIYLNPQGIYKACKYKRVYKGFIILRSENIK